MLYGLCIISDFLQMRNIHGNAKVRKAHLSAMKILRERCYCLRAKELREAI